MERLTFIKGQHRWYQGRNPTPYSSKETFQSVCDRLGRIEDILGDDYDLDRLRKLVEADRKGMSVVLPCKRGDVLWSYYNYPRNHIYSFKVTDVSTLNGRTMLNTDIMSVVDARDIGQTVFLTREEAERALRKEGDHEKCVCDEAAGCEAVPEE